MVNIAKTLIVFGILLILVGGILFFLARFGFTLNKFPLGRLPGDLYIKTKDMACLFPIVTSILLSILLTVVLNLVVRLLNR